MKLTTQEKIKLVLEGIATVVILLLLILASFRLIQLVIELVSINIYDLALFQYILNPENQFRLFLLTIFLMFFIIIFIAVIVMWRLARRRRRFEMQHIIDGLLVIARGNYDYRITGSYSQDMEEVVESIHLLVDNTVEAMEEERKIEESKDALITNVSHDIRTPLTSIIGYLGLIEARQYKNKEELLKYVHIAYQKALQMQSLVTDLFEYTQVSQENASFQLKTFDLVRLMEQLVVEFELEKEENNMEIKVISEASTIYMKADPEKLVRVFTNIISNAFKYGKGGNQILIHMKQSTPHACIRISNNGETLEKKSLEAIFERFYRQESSRSDKGGSGLGLAIAKNIIEKHGGTIHANVSKGWSHFEIVLPLRSHFEYNETKNS